MVFSVNLAQNIIVFIGCNITLINSYIIGMLCTIKLILPSVNLMLRCSSQAKRSASQVQTCT